MILYRCDRCGSETSPDKLWEIELVSTPYALEGGKDSDKADWKRLGDLCADCSDLVEEQALALVKATTAVGTALVEDVYRESLDMARVRELCAHHGITDTDTLKHTLEDAARWEADLRAGRMMLIVDARSSVRADGGSTDLDDARAPSPDRPTGGDRE